MCPALKKGTKKFHYTSNSCGFFCDFTFFHETKISRVDVKVQVYSNFSKNKIWKKIKYPSSMRNGRCNTPKCRGKVQKFGVLYTHFAKYHGQPQRTPPQKKKPKKNGKRSPTTVCAR
jgi:hypothetical protein